MIGFETRIKEEESPFHKDIRPSFSIIYVHLLIIVPFFYACFVWSTQNGFVAIDEPIPARPEHFIVSSTDPG